MWWGFLFEYCICFSPKHCFPFCLWLIRRKIHHPLIVNKHHAVRRAHFVVLFGNFDSTTEASTHVIKTYTTISRCMSRRAVKSETIRLLNNMTLAPLPPQSCLTHSLKVIIMLREIQKFREHYGISFIIYETRERKKRA